MQHPHSPPPVAVWPYYVALLIAVTGTSSGGMFFALQPDTPPVLKAAWRLTFTALLLTPGFFVQWRRADAALRARWWSVVPTMTASAFYFALHFAGWSWSVSHTSLPHAILFTSTTPIVIVMRSTLLYAAARVLYPGARRSEVVSRSDGGRGLEDAECPSPSGYSTSRDDVALITSSASGVSSSSGGGGGSGGFNSGGGGSGGDGVSMAAFQQQPAFSPAARSSGGDTLCITAPAGGAATPGGNAPLSSGNAPLPYGARSRRSWAACARAWVPADAQPPTVLEASGTLIGFAACAALVTVASDGGAGAAHASSAAGDFAGFLAGAVFVLYLDVGSSLRAWMPLFMYGAPVTGGAGAMLTLAALAGEECVAVGGLGACSVLGWLGGGAPLLYTALASLCAGVLGHTFINLSLQHVSPLVVSVACLSEPFSGSLLGWAVGVASVPSPLTGVAGVVLVGGAAMVTLGGRPAAGGGAGGEGRPDSGHTGAAAAAAAEVHDSRLATEWLPLGGVLGEVTPVKEASSARCKGCEAESPLYGECKT